jgi:hypothetical protein
VCGVIPLGDFAMIDNFADWLCNLLLWTAIISLLVLLYTTSVSPDLLHEPLLGPIAAGAVVVLSLWPKH